MFAAFVSVTLFSFVNPWGCYISTHFAIERNEEIKFIIKNEVPRGAKYSIKGGLPT